MSAQQTLTMDDADNSMMWGAGTLPTMITCPKCGDVLLRSRRRDHRHDTKSYRHLGNPDSQDDAESVLNDDTDEDDGPEELGNWYDIELSYSVTYSFRVPAHSEHRAVDIAKDWKLDARPADGHHTFTRKNERGTITSQDVPDDFDPYGSEPLHKAIKRAKED